MPIYEYECRSCGAIVERMQKSTDEPPLFCERCGKCVPPRKIMSNTSFKLVGPGWGSD